MEIVEKIALFCYDRVALIFALALFFVPTFFVQASGLLYPAPFENYASRGVNDATGLTNTATALGTNGIMTCRETFTFSGISIYVHSMSSTTIPRNFTFTIGTTTLATTTVSNQFDGVSGWVNFLFSTPYECTKNATSTYNWRISSYKTGETGGIRRVVDTEQVSYPSTTTQPYLITNQPVFFSVAQVFSTLNIFSNVNFSGDTFLNQIYYPYPAATSTGGGTIVNITDSDMVSEWTCETDDGETVCTATATTSVREYDGPTYYEWMLVGGIIIFILLYMLMPRLSILRYKDE